MPIVRTQHNKNYTVVNNFICKDSRLSWKAKGIWLYAFSRPDDWSFHTNDLINQSTDGEDSVRSGLKELENTGYLRMSRIRNSDGTLGGTEWIFHELPILKEIVPRGENPDLDNPGLDNPPILSTDVIPIIENNNNNMAADPVVVVFSDEIEKRKLLQEFNFDERITAQLLPYSIETFQKAMELYKHDLSLDKIDNPHGFIRNAIAGGWTLPKKITKDDKAQITQRLIDERKQACEELYDKYKHHIKFKGLMDIRLSEDKYVFYEKGILFFAPYIQDDCVFILQQYINRCMKIINDEQSKEII